MIIKTFKFSLIITLLLTPNISKSSENNVLNKKLINAIKNENCKEIKKLVECGADLNKPLRFHQYPLNMTLSEGLSKAFQQLIDLGADPYITKTYLGNIFKQAEESLSWSYLFHDEDCHKVLKGRNKIIEILKTYKKYLEDKRAITITTLLQVPDVIINLICDYSENYEK